MHLDQLPEYVPATPAYVLAVLRDEHRQQCCYDGEADSAIDLSFNSTVAEWRQAGDLVDWRSLGRACNAIWSIDRTDAEWFAVLEPANQRRLADVCDCIAANAVRPRIRPARLLGKECGPAGAFLAIRALLHRAGAATHGLTPSSALAPYARRHPDVFLGVISRLAPGALPRVTIRTPLYDCMTMLMILSISCGCAGAGLNSYPIMIVAFVSFIVGWAGTWVVAGCVPPASVEFDGLLTFRDLAIAIDRAEPA